ncbi:MAG: nitrilase family protein [Streptosporangiaceae bacterium]
MGRTVSTEVIASQDVIVAAAQTRPTIGDIEGNLAEITVAVMSAAAAGARLVVLPELCTTGYMFSGRAEASALAEPIPSGASTRALTDLCRELDLHLVAGIAERDEDEIYNSAVLLGPAGHIGTYRKLHLWDNENTIFAPGNVGLPVYQTPLGRIGLLICYDAWFPEAFRALALQGADAVCLPTNWVPIPGQQPGKPAMALSLCQSAAHVNSMHIIAADRVGIERDQPFIGQSVIVGPTGWPLTEAASSEDTEVIAAPTDLTSGVRLRRWNKHNDPIRDRRPSEYTRILA